ncbi:MAG: enoyl-CoA hydratase/isomerase family protein [Nitrococcus mobilis]|nr:enoyl-CoA hydratase/isomerase family protein [Nitrococcus mobilis]
MPQPVFEDEQYLRVRYDRVPASQGALIATALIHHPPVNTLSGRVLEALARAFEHLEHHEEVRAVVLSARAAGSFSAGADIRELLTEINEPAEARALAAKAHALLASIEAMDKPVIAAIDGPALGGGCELAMACHFRIGNARTRLGQPEINLFLPPAFGGTQRLPRLVEAALAEPLTSLPIALGWLLCGRPIRADIAKDGGLLDEVVTGSTDVLSRARLLAAQCARGTQNPVAEAMGFRRQQRAQWDTPETMDWPEIEQDPYLQQCLAQTRYAGRGQVAETIVELVRTGLEEGIEAGLAAEVDAFTRFVLDPEHGGKKGIRLFLDKRSPALPLRRRPQFSAAELERLEDEYWLLPIGSPFVPGVTPLPQMQYAWAVMKDPATGEPDQGAPKEKEKEIVVEVPQPKPNEALLYVLASELDRTDVSAITGLPSSVFELHDEDEHVTGSGGLGLVAELGEAVQAEGRLQVGELVAIHPGRRELLDPRTGAEPMMSRFTHQGYETPDGTHQQFMLVQGPQCLPLPAGVPLEAAGSFLVAAGTAYRGLINALEIQPGKRMLVEDAGCDAGRWAVKLGLALGVEATGLAPNEAHATAVRELGADAVNRETESLADCFTQVPADPSRWSEWQAQGEAWLAAVRTANGRAPVDYAVSYAGAPGFARSFQALAEGGTLALQSAAADELMTFLGKPGTADPADMLQRARLRPGETVVIYYGMTGEEDDDATGQNLLAAAQAARARLAIITRTQAQRDHVCALGLGDALIGALSIEALEQRAPKFLWGEAPLELPDSHTDSAGCKAARRVFTERTVKPLAGALGQLLRQSNGPAGGPDLIIERARQDTLALSALLVRPHTGRIVYCEEMAQRRYSFYALSVSKGQRRILMPRARIVGTHLCNAAEAEAVRRLIEMGIIEVPTVHLFDWRECPTAHQAIWESRLASATGGADKAMLNHALPGTGLKNADELAVRWGNQKVQRGR